MTGVAASKIIILNGAPRAGKSSIARAIQAKFSGVWLNFGIDTYMEAVPEHLRPGPGLRPGGERPELEPLVVRFYAGLYETISAHARLGFNVVADLGHHDAYSKPLHILPDCARRLEEFTVLFVGVRCAIDTIMARRNAGQAGREGQYLTGAAGQDVPEPVLAWQREVHRPGIYDLEVDTSTASPEACAKMIEATMIAGIKRPTAFEQLARM